MPRLVAELRHELADTLRVRQPSGQSELADALIRVAAILSASVHARRRPRFGQSARVASQPNLVVMVRIVLYWVRLDDGWLHEPLET
jgi:hypothetical protein